MPRRYSDYADTFAKWNVISSIGSLLSILGAFYLLSVLWYSLRICSKTSVFDSGSLEFTDRLPTCFHSYRELVIYY